VTNGRAEDPRKLEILQATWRLIAERGYHEVRVADIAKAVGTSTGTVHYHFPGKQDVLIEALRYCVEQAFARQSLELRRLDDARERLLRLIDMQLPRAGQVRDEWSVWAQFWSEAAIRPELRPAHNDFYARWRGAVESTVRRGQRQGVFRSDVDAAEFALHLSALTDGLAIQVLTGSPDVSVTRMRDVLTDYIRDELVASPAGR
jgi:AcrR family transcriptional regulator